MSDSLHQFSTNEKRMGAAWARIRKGRSANLAIDPFLNSPTKSCDRSPGQLLVAVLRVRGGQSSHFVCVVFIRKSDLDHSGHQSVRLVVLVLAEDWVSVSLCV